MRSMDGMDMSERTRPAATSLSGEGALTVSSLHQTGYNSSDAQIAHCTSICSQLEQFSSRGYNYMKTGKWNDAKVAFMIVRGSGNQLTEIKLPDNNIRLRAVECLNASGKHLISMLYMKEAISCFNLTIELLTESSPCDKSADIMAHAIQSIVHCHLHTSQPKSAAEALTWIHNQFQFCDLYLHPHVQEGFGQANLENGMEFIKHQQYNEAADSLESSRGYFMKNFASFCGSETEARLLSALGYCLHMNTEKRASGILEQARRLWLNLRWPLHEIDTIVNTLKYYAENHLQSCESYDDYAVDQELLQLHTILAKEMKSMQVADSFTYLGTVAFHHGNELKAVKLFEASYNLYKKEHPTKLNLEELIKLLRFIGVSSYNCRDFERAVKAYLECLNLLETHFLNDSTKVGQVAECCAALGFTYSRLRDFDNMLCYYEKALANENRLSAEDLELLITNIGSLYHVKSAMLRQNGEIELSNSFNLKAKNAFSKALRYSWKSFPFINYGYYLFYQGDFSEAVPVLQQGYLNGVIDKDTVEFDHTEDPILIDDLKLELSGREDIRMPSTVVALYLKILAQVSMGNKTGAAQSASLLEQEAESCKYSAYYTNGYGVERMKSLSYSLLGYSFKALGQRNRAIMAFKRALSIVSDNKAAKHNIQCLRNDLSA